jgi:hypothetical protein
VEIALHKNACSDIGFITSSATNINISKIPPIVPNRERILKTYLEYIPLSILATNYIKRKVFLLLPALFLGVIF